MIVSIIFNTEYMKVQERIKWFLKSASYAKKQDVVLVTHEYMKTHLREMIDKLGERFYDDFEMDHLTVEDAENLEVCYIPDSVFDEVYNRNGAQTRALLELSNERNNVIEDYMIRFIDGALSKRGLKSPDYIECCLHTFASVRYVAEYYQCPLLPYVFSAIRKVHGYTQTLYMAHFDKDLFGARYAEMLYERYDYKKLSFPILSKHEIMALLGKKRNLQLIPLMDTEGKYEMGIMVEGFQILPQSYQYDLITDDDLYFEATRWYTESNILTRVHPIKMDRFGITRKHVKNDPAQFLISCKRFSTVQSQMITKAAMWNRVPCVIGSALPFGFLFSRDFKSRQVVSDEKLNFLLFCYFVPDCCMFDSEYWKWRKLNPTAEEIIERHLHAIFDQLKIDFDILFDANNRFERLLQERGCSRHEIEEIKKEVNEDEIVYECMSSRIDVVLTSGAVDDEYCRNERAANGQIHSHFELCDDAKIIRLKLQDDRDGYISISSIVVNGEELGGIQQQYLTKGESLYDISVDGRSFIDVYWTITDFETTIH